MNGSSEEIRYYAAFGLGHGRDDPSGLIRRRLVQPGPVDEALQRDFTWRWTSGLMRWERGEIDSELAEVSEEEADRIIERFRAKWSAENEASP
ncbi:MAG: hypothetical protein ACRD2C_08105 [Acidimicrobiales bacterium]